ncbi:unnamed protein product [Mucor hiemalis]
MSAAGFNALWLLCVLLLLIAFIIAIRKRRLAAKAQENNDRNTHATTYIRHTGQEVRIHMPSTVHPQQNTSTIIQPPPPAFDPEEPPPPSYQDFRKDIRIQPST